MQRLILKLKQFLFITLKIIFIGLPSLYLIVGVVYYLRGADIVKVLTIQPYFIYFYAVYELLSIPIIIYLTIISIVLVIKLKNILYDKYKSQYDLITKGTSVDYSINNQLKYEINKAVLKGTKFLLLFLRLGLKDIGTYLLGLFIVINLGSFLFLSYYSPSINIGFRGYDNEINYQNFYNDSLNSSTKVSFFSYNVLRYSIGDLQKIKGDLGIIPDIIFLQEVYSKDFIPDCNEHKLNCYISEYDQDVGIVSPYEITFINKSISGFGGLDNSVSGYFLKDGKKVCFVSGHIINPTTPGTIMDSIRKADKVFDMRKSQYDNMFNDIYTLREGHNCSTIVVSGDFNTTPNDYRIHQFRNEGFYDISSLNKTFPSNLPLLKIDYIFVNAGVVKDRYSTKIIESDHIGIYAEVTIK